MRYQVIVDGIDFSEVVDYLRTEDTPENMAGRLEEMTYTFAIERLSSGMIGEDDAGNVGFMKGLIRAIRMIKPVSK